MAFCVCNVLQKLQKFPLGKSIFPYNRIKHLTKFYLISVKVRGANVLQKIKKMTMVQTNLKVIHKTKTLAVNVGNSVLKCSLNLRILQLSLNILTLFHIEHLTQFGRLDGFCMHMYREKSIFFTNRAKILARMNLNRFDEFVLF